MTERKEYPTWIITCQIGGKRYQRADVSDSVIQNLKGDIFEELCHLVARPAPKGHHFPDEVNHDR